jgi:hypothetical protein
MLSLSEGHTLIISRRTRKTGVAASCYLGSIHPSKIKTHDNNPEIVCIARITQSEKLKPHRTRDFPVLLPLYATNSIIRNKFDRIKQQIPDAPHQLTIIRRSPILQEMETSSY